MVGMVGLIYGFSGSSGTSRESGQTGNEAPEPTNATTSGDGAGDPAPTVPDHEAGADRASPSPVPPADGALCPVCGRGPFVSLHLYERHWRQTHAGGAAFAADAVIDEELAERATDDDAEVPWP